MTRCLTHSLNNRIPSCTQVEQGAGFFRSCSSLVSTAAQTVQPLFSNLFLLQPVKERCGQINATLLPFTFITAKDNINTLLQPSKKEEKKQALVDLFNKTIKALISWGEKFFAFHPVLMGMGVAYKARNLYALSAACRHSQAICKELRQVVTVRKGGKKYLSRAQSIQNLQVLKKHVPSLAPEKEILQGWQKKLSILENKAAPRGLHTKHQLKKRSREVEKLTKNLRQGSEAKSQMAQLAFLSMAVNCVAMVVLSTVFHCALLGKFLLTVGSAFSVAKYLYLRQQWAYLSKPG